jgi:DNA-binding CsgD family transcriptional regulator
MPAREAQLVALSRAGTHITLELGEMFDIGRFTVY